jgi:uncharacterized membrane protein YhaH (DUF805 family)
MNNPALTLGANLYKLWGALEFFRFSSRLNRTKYFIFYAVWILFYFLIFLKQNYPILVSIILILNTLNFYFSAKRRLNDINFSGLWLLLTFLLIWFFSSFIYTDLKQLCTSTGEYFSYALFLIGFFPGTKGVNKYGEQPKSLPKIYSYLLVMILGLIFIMCAIFGLPD